jgi:hypothetical protein
MTAVPMTLARPRDPVPANSPRRPRGGQAVGQREAAHEAVRRFGSGWRGALGHAAAGAPLLDIAQFAMPPARLARLSSYHVTTVSAEKIRSRSCEWVIAA